MRHRRLGSVDHRGEIADAELAGIDQGVDDLCPSGVAERLEQLDERAPRDDGTPPTDTD